MQTVHYYLLRNFFFFKAVTHEQNRDLRKGWFRILMKNMAVKECVGVASMNLSGQISMWVYSPRLSRKEPAENIREGEDPLSSHAEPANHIFSLTKGVSRSWLPIRCFPLVPGATLDVCRLPPLDGRRWWAESEADQRMKPTAWQQLPCSSHRTLVNCLPWSLELCSLSNQEITSDRTEVLTLSCPFFSSFQGQLAALTNCIYHI